ncbi:MAG: RNA polymerase factor sigma-54, partial [Planctomycetes bacterium]|nr:RNA polymerase factor sigma-54 [Planctomycetota bacterium]
SRYGGEEFSGRRAAPSGEDNKLQALQNHADRPASLIDHLQLQIGFLELDAELAFLARQMTGNIDQRGYLIGSLEEIASALSVPIERARAALHVIQGLDPRGVGASDLRECLLLQLGESDLLERRLIGEHLQDLLENRLPKLSDLLQVSLWEVKEAVGLISLLNPHPGNAFTVHTESAVVPEIFVDEIDGNFNVRIEEGVLPALRISPACSSMLRQEGHNPKVVDYVRRKIEAARWLIHAIEQRRRTMLDIAQAIVDHQVGFMRQGPGHLSALTMQQIADEVSVHISTVSRAANGKYMETPYGVMELRRFFTGGVERADGGIESRDNICGMIKEIIDAESPRRPLSDAQLTKRLQQRGLDIARRTVTKYRERSSIPPARLRKRH